MTGTHRSAARVICLDADDRILLLQWHDPVDDTLVWEPPGGGVEAGESFLEAARRELREETGLDPAPVLPPSVTVQRRFRWKGRLYVGPEEFFLARYPEEVRPELGRAGLMADEREILAGYAWLTQGEVADLEGLQPPELLDVAGRLGVSGSP